MKIFVTGRPGHMTYTKMAQKPMEAFRELGHQAEMGKPQDIGQDFTLILGSTCHWDEVKDLPGKKIYWNHGVDWYKGGKTDGNERIRSVFENADAVSFHSEFAKHMTQKVLENNREGPIIFNAAKPNFVMNYPRITNVCNIATTAVWRDWKRLDRLERIIDKYNENFGAPKLHLYVYGRGDDPGHKPWGNPEYIHYLGIRDEFPKYFECHFYAQLSFNDFSPATVGEAMATGLPVICTNSGGSKDIVADSGIILENDPFIDYPFNIYSYTEIPELDSELVIKGFQQMMRMIEAYRSKTKDRVLSIANSEYSAKQFIQLYESK